METPSRAPAPPALDLGPVRAVSSPVDGTPRSADSVTSSPFSGDYHYASPTSTTSPLLWARQDASASAVPSTADAMKRPAAVVVAQRKVNAHSYCGRHSDEFLFGGKGLGDLWRAVVKK